jgi:hypothetical protein
MSVATKSYIADWEGRFHDVATSYFDSFTVTGSEGHNTLEPLLHKDIGESITELFSTPGNIQKHFGEFKTDLIHYLGDSADLLITSGAAEVGTLTGQVGLSVAAGKFLSDQLKKATKTTSGVEYKRGEWVVIRCGYKHQTKEQIKSEEWMSVQMFETTFDATSEFLQPNYIIGFFLQRELNDKLTCFNFTTLKPGSYHEEFVEPMPEVIKKSLDTNKAYSEARELYIMKDANIDPKVAYKFQIGAEVLYEGVIHNVVDRCTDGRLLLEGATHTRTKVNPDEVTPYRDNYSAMMNDKQRFTSSGDFVWCNVNGKTTLAVISYFLQDKAVVFECMTGKEHILHQKYIKTVDSKDYMQFVSIPSFAKFRQYAVQSDSFLERFLVPATFKYICQGIFDDHTIIPPDGEPIFGESHIDAVTGKPTAGIYLRSDQKVAEDIFKEDLPSQNILDSNPDMGNSWNSSYVLMGVVGLFLVASVL